LVIDRIAAYGASESNEKAQPMASTHLATETLF